MIYESPMGGGVQTEIRSRKTMDEIQDAISLLTRQLADELDRVRNKTTRAAIATVD
jgi:hypothetical protein